MNTKSRRPGLLTIVAVALAASLLGGGVAVASDDFSDVGDSHPFHDEIGAIAEAGITTGFDDGTYRPGVAVSRGAMAAFMARGFGRATLDTGTASNFASGQNVTLGNAFIDAGATGGETDGYVVVTAAADLSINTSWCSCSFNLWIEDVNNALASDTSSTNAAPMEGITATNMHLGQTWVFPISGDVQGEYRLMAETFHNGAGASTRSMSGSITAVYVPFDGSGNADAL
jgi:hypothetical protein